MRRRLKYLHRLFSAVLSGIFQNWADSVCPIRVNEILFSKIRQSMTDELQLDANHTVGIWQLLGAKLHENIRIVQQTVAQLYELFNKNCLYKIRGTVSPELVPAWEDK